MTINNRISEFCKYKKFKQAHLVGAGLGSKQTISHIFLGRQLPNYEFLDGFLRLFPDLNARWLITGEGDMLDKGDDNAKAPEEQPATYAHLLELYTACVRECGVLEERVRCLQEDINRLKGASNRTTTKAS